MSPPDPPGEPGGPGPDEPPERDEPDEPGPPGEPDMLTQPREPAARSEPGRLVGAVVGGRYEIIGVIGRGGMSTVYRARHQQIGRVVAIKVLDQWSFDREEVLQRFHREARAAAALQSPHIAGIHDFFVEDGRAFLVQEYLDGRSVDAIVREDGRLAPARAVRLLVQACGALELAHAAGIIHRDIKPSNFIVEDRADHERLILLDFGISKLIAEDARDAFTTRAGTVMGTPAYMAPEQAMSAKDVDHRADLYALGSVAFELVTGQPPFSGSSFSELLVRVLHEPPPSPRASGAPISPALDAVIARCLAKAPGDRYQSAIELREALEATPELGGTATAGKAAGPGGRFGIGSAGRDVRAHWAGTDHDWPGPTTGGRGVSLLSALLWPFTAPIAGLVNVARALAYVGRALLRLGTRSPAAARLAPGRPGTGHAARAGDAELFRYLDAAGLPRAPDDAVDDDTDAGQPAAGRLYSLAPRAAAPARADDLPPGRYYALVLADTPGPRESALATVVFQRGAAVLDDLEGTRDEPCYVLLCDERPPGVGVYREWHALAHDRGVHVLSVRPRAIRAALAAGAAAAHFRGLLSQTRGDPFLVDGPIDDELEFFGSRRDIDALLQDLRARRAGFALFGLDKWGTTSLLRRVRRELADERRATAWADLQECETVTAEAVARRWIDDLRRCVDRAAEQATDRAAVRARGAARVPPAEARRRAEIARALAAADLAPDAAGIAACARACAEVGLPGPPVLFLDRVDEIASAAGPGRDPGRERDSDPDAIAGLLRLLAALAAGVRHPDGCAVVVAGADDAVHTRRHIARGERALANPLWRKLTPRYAPVFAREGTEAFLTTVGARAGIAFTADALAAAHAVTGGHKYLCRLLGSEVRARLAQPDDDAPRDAAGAEIVRAAAHAVVVAHQDYFAALLARAPSGSRTVLAALAAGPAARGDLIASAGASATDDAEGSGGDRVDALGFLLRHRLVRERAGMCELAIGMLADWMRLVHPAAAGAGDPPDLADAPDRAVATSGGVRLAHAGSAGGGSPDATLPGLGSGEPAPGAGAASADDAAGAAVPERQAGEADTDGGDAPEPAAGGPTSARTPGRFSETIVLPPGTPAAQLSVLRTVLVTAFTGPELEDLLAGLGVSPAGVIRVGRTPDEQARDVVQWFENRRRFGELRAAVAELRPQYSLREAADELLGRAIEAAGAARGAVLRFAHGLVEPVTARDRAGRHVIGVPRPAELSALTACAAAATGPVVMSGAELADGLADPGRALTATLTSVPVHDGDGGPAVLIAPVRPGGATGAGIALIGVLYLEYASSPGPSAPAVAAELAAELAGLLSQLGAAA